jgi:hypothetical protein
MDDSARIELTYRHVRRDGLGKFELRACDEHDGSLAEGEGDTVEAAIDALHEELKEYASRLREVAATFD